MGLFDFLKAKQEHPEIPVLTRENGLSQFFDHYFNKRIPVLLKGVAKDWELMDKWSKDYIMESSGSYVCNIISDSRPASSKDQTTLNNYFSRVKGKSTLTLERFDKDDFPAFLNDIPIPNELFGMKDIARYFFFHSVTDAGTLPHNHRDAFNILQSGSKKWAFFDASQMHSPLGFKVQREFFASYPQGSHARDWFKNELPKLGKRLPDVQTCIQEAGDIVYIPSEYSHTVLNLSEVMGLVIERHRP